VVGWGELFWWLVLVSWVVDAIILNGCGVSKRGEVYEMFEEGLLLLLS